MEFDQLRPWATTPSEDATRERLPPQRSSTPASACANTDELSQSLQRSPAPFSPSGSAVSQKNQLSRVKKNLAVNSPAEWKRCYFLASLMMGGDDYMSRLLRGCEHYGFMMHTVEEYARHPRMKRPVEHRLSASVLKSDRSLVQRTFLELLKSSGTCAPFVWCASSLNGFETPHALKGYFNKRSMFTSEWSPGGFSRLGTAVQRHSCGHGSTPMSAYDAFIERLKEIRRKCFRSNTPERLCNFAFSTVKSFYWTVLGQERSLWAKLISGKYRSESTASGLRPWGTNIVIYFYIDSNAIYGTGMTEKGKVLYHLEGVSTKQFELSLVRKTFVNDVSPRMNKPMIATSAHRFQVYFYPGLTVLKSINGNDSTVLYKTDELCVSTGLEGFPVAYRKKDQIEQLRRQLSLSPRQRRKLGFKSPKISSRGLSARMSGGRRKKLIMKGSRLECPALHPAPPPLLHGLDKRTEQTAYPNIVDHLNDQSQIEWQPDPFWNGQSNDAGRSHTFTLRPPTSPTTRGRRTIASSPRQLRTNILQLNVSLPARKLDQEPTFDSDINRVLECPFSPHLVYRHDKYSLQENATSTFEKWNERLFQVVMKNSTPTYCCCCCNFNTTSRASMVNHLKIHRQDKSGNIFSSVNFYDFDKLADGSPTHLMGIMNVSVAKQPSHEVVMDDGGDGRGIPPSLSCAKSLMENKRTYDRLLHYAYM